MDRKTMLQYLGFKTLNDIPDSSLKHLVMFKKGCSEYKEIKTTVAIAFINYILAEIKEQPIVNLLDFKNITRDKLKLSTISSEWREKIYFHFKIKIMGGKSNEITAAAIIKKIINILPGYELVIQTTKVKVDGATKVLVSYSILCNES
jgi:hypothetical protein